jgi:FtsP/CotA-like multicopper oxidase with cupredoxin domain
MPLSRRDLLKLTALVGSPHAALGAPASAPERPAVEVELRAVVRSAILDPRLGRASEVWRFEGRVLAGPAATLTNSDSGYLGPTFRVKRGQRLRVHFKNELPEPSIVHFHGLHVSEANDGHPRLVVGSGGSYTYDFVVEARPGTYWYHPHPHDRTGPQVYRGLAGLFLVVDPDDAARGLPSAEQDLPIVLQERTLSPGGELVYDPNPMLGFLGERTFVNGLGTQTTTVKAASYRLRLLNASNARIYKLAWSNGRPLSVLGTDGGLLSAPVVRPYVMLAPGQRIELWADFGQTVSEDEVWLESLPYSGGGGMMMGGGMMGRQRGSSTAPPNGTAFKVCRFVVRGKGKRLPLPKTLMKVTRRPDSEVDNLAAPRAIRISMAHRRGWQLNGSSFGMLEVAPNERVRLDTTEDWEFENLAGMMSMPHPMHLHGGQFQVVSRSVSPRFQTAADSVKDGLIDEGLQDVVLVMPGERVKIRVRFERHAGLFLYHCHNLEHEDMGMMRNYLVEA